MVARAASAVKVAYDDRSYTVSEKGPNDPLTSADLLANQILRDGLSALLPEAGWLSEESPEDPARLSRAAAWVVDPIDGTREFVERVPEFSVSVGLSYAGVAVAGCVALPAESRLFVGARGAGVEEYSVAADGTLGVGIARSLSLFAPERPAGEARVMFSRSEERAGLGKQLIGWELTPSGSIARKLALLAVGEAELCVSLRPKNEWDICGGVALIRAVGGVALELESGQEHRFNQRGTRTNGLVAGVPQLVHTFTDWFQAHKLSVDQNRS